MELVIIFLGEGPEHEDLHEISRLEQARKGSLGSCFEDREQHLCKTFSLLW